MHAYFTMGLRDNSPSVRTLMSSLSRRCGDSGAVYRRHDLLTYSEYTYIKYVFTNYFAALHSSNSVLPGFGPESLMFFQRPYYVITPVGHLSLIIMLHMCKRAACTRKKNGNDPAANEAAEFLILCVHSVEQSAICFA